MKDGEKEANSYESQFFSINKCFGFNNEHPPTILFNEMANRQVLNEYPCDFYKLHTRLIMLGSSNC